MLVLAKQVIYPTKGLSTQVFAVIAVTGVRGQPIAMLQLVNATGRKPDDAGSNPAIATKTHDDW